MDDLGKVAVIAGILGAILLAGILMAPSPEEPAPAPAPAKETELGKSDYIKIAVELGCLSTKLEDKSKLPEKTMEIYKKYNLNVQTWTDLARKYGTDASVGPEIAKGMAACR